MPLCESELKVGTRGFRILFVWMARKSPNCTIDCAHHRLQPGDSDTLRHETSYRNLSVRPRRRVRELVACKLL